MNPEETKIGENKFSAMMAKKKPLRKNHVVAAIKCLDREIQGIVEKMSNLDKVKKDVLGQVDKVLIKAVSELYEPSEVTSERNEECKKVYAVKRPTNMAAEKDTLRYSGHVAPPIPHPTLLNAGEITWPRKQHFDQPIVGILHGP